MCGRFAFIFFAFDGRYLLLFRLSPQYATNGAVYEGDDAGVPQPTGGGPHGCDRVHDPPQEGSHEHRLPGFLRGECCLPLPRHGLRAQTTFCVDVRQVCCKTKKRPTSRRTDGSELSLHRTWNEIPGFGIIFGWEMERVEHSPLMLRRQNRQPVEVALPCPLQVEPTL